MVPWAFQQPGTQSMIKSSYSHKKDFPFIPRLRIRSGVRKESHRVRNHGGSLTAVVGEQNEGLEMILAGRCRACWRYQNSCLGGWVQQRPSVDVRTTH